MAKSCFICGEMTTKKIENKEIEKILAHLIVAENVKDFYILSKGAFAAASVEALKQMQSVVSGVRLHENTEAPKAADVVLCPFSEEDAARSQAISPLLCAAVPPRLICLGQENDE